MCVGYFGGGKVIPLNQVKGTPESDFQMWGGVVGKGDWPLSPTDSLNLRAQCYHGQMGCAME